MAKIPFNELNILKQEREVNMKSFDDLSKDDLEILSNCLIYILSTHKNLSSPERLIELKDRFLNEIKYREEKETFY